MLHTPRHNWHLCLLLVIVVSLFLPVCAFAGLLDHWYAGDGHVHSTFSSVDLAYIKHPRTPRPEVQAMADKAKEKGLSWIIMTDHEDMVSGTWADMRDACNNVTGDVLVIPGEELGSVAHKLSDGHYLAYDISNYVDAENYGCQTMIDAVKNVYGFGFIAHPFAESQGNRI